MALGKQHKPKLTEWEKELRRRRWIAGTYGVVSLYMLFYFLLPTEFSSTQIVRFTLSFLTTADHMAMNLIQILLENVSPVR